MADVTFSREELAKSCCTVFHTALQLTHEAWERQSLEKQLPWLRLAQGGPIRLEQLEGATYAQVGREMWLVTLAERAAEASDAWDHLPWEFHYAWEAVARHLMTMLDADDVENVPELEQGWRQWLLAKLRPQEVLV